MGAYILRRLLLMIPTLFGIMAVSFVIVQFAPGGPVEQFISELSSGRGSISTAITGNPDALGRQIIRLIGQSCAAAGVPVAGCAWGRCSQRAGPACRWPWRCTGWC